MKKLLVDGFTTKIACPTGSFRVLVYPSGVDVSTSILRYLSACLRTRRRAAGTQRPDALSTPIAATTMTNTASKFARLGSSRSSPVAASNMIPGWACTAGSLSRVSPYCTGSAGSASDGKSSTTSTKPSSASPAPSSAGDASTTSQTVRSSKGRSATMQKSHIWRPAIFIRLQAEAEQSGGSARAYLADLSPHQRPSHPGRPRHDSEPGLHIYPGHRVPGTCASAA